MAKAKSSKKNGKSIKDFTEQAVKNQKKEELESKKVEQFMNQKKTEEKVMKKSTKIKNEVKKIEAKKSASKPNVLTSTLKSAINSEKKKPANGNGNGNLSKFQHKAACRSGRIDSLVLEGKLTTDQILKTLRKEFGSCADGKVKSHIGHLVKEHNVTLHASKNGIVKVTQAK